MVGPNAVKWRNSAELVQGQATGDVQLVFHPVHQNVLTCQHCNGATVITTDKLQWCCSSLLQSCTSSFSVAASEKLCCCTSVVSTDTKLWATEECIGRLKMPSGQWIIQRSCFHKLEKKIGVGEYKGVILHNPHKCFSNSSLQISKNKKQEKQEVIETSIDYYSYFFAICFLWGSFSVHSMTFGSCYFTILSMRTSNKSL